MENQKFTKKELVAMGLTAAQIKLLVPVEFKKTASRGRPAGLYTQEQVDAVRAGTYVPPATTTPAAAVVEGVATDEVVGTETVEDEVVAVTPVVEGPVADLSDADFAQAA
jgi:hypothetical protein